jgi:hypothetical protein
MHDRQRVLNHFLFGDNCSLFSTSNSVPCSHKAILVGYCDTRLASMRSMPRNRPLEIETATHLHSLHRERRRNPPHPTLVLHIRPLRRA